MTKTCDEKINPSGKNSHKKCKFQKTLKKTNIEVVQHAGSKYYHNKNFGQAACFDER